MKVVHNKEINRFEMEINDKFAVVNYTFANNIYHIMRVYVPKELEGQGIGSKLLSQTLDIIEQEGAKIVPICPFVVTFLKRYPDRKNLLAD